MRVAIVSDVHGNLSALNAVAADLRTQSPDLIVFAGDLVSSGSSNAEVVESVASLGWPGVYGNTDEMLWKPQRLAEHSARAPALAQMWDAINDIRDFTLDALGPSHLQYLQALPGSWSGHGIEVVHASPGNAWVSPSPSSTDDELATPYATLSAPLVVFGHVHAPFIRVIGDRTIANAGALSLSYDRDPRAAYLLVDDGEACIRRVNYDVEEECRALVRRRHPHQEWICATLRSARFVPFSRQG